MGEQGKQYWGRVKESLYIQNLQQPFKTLGNSMISRSNLNQQEQNWNPKTSEKKVLIINTAADFMHQE